MSTFLFEMDSNTQTVQLKGVHHKYLAQVSPPAAAAPPHSKWEVRMKPLGRGLCMEIQDWTLGQGRRPAWQPPTKHEQAGMHAGLAVTLWS